MGSGGRGCGFVVRIRGLMRTQHFRIRSRNSSGWFIRSLAIMSYDVTKVVILGIEYRYRSLSSIEVSSMDVIAGIVLTLPDVEELLPPISDHE